MKLRWLFVLTLILVFSAATYFYWGQIIEYGMWEAKIPLTCSLLLKTDYKDECNLYFAYEKDDVRYCEKIRAEIYKNLCYENMASTLNNPSLCDKINNSTSRDYCLHGYVLLDDHNPESIRLCDQIQNQSLRFLCHRSLPTHQLDPSLCDKLSGDEKTHCLSYVTNNPVLCWKISDNYTRNRCYLDAAHYMQDPLFCAKIMATSMKDGCYYNMVAEYNETGICSEITETWLRDSCYIKEAVNQFNPGLCGGILDTDGRDDCYSQTGYAAGDPYICFNINSSWIRGQCFFNTAESLDFCYWTDDTHWKESCILKIAVQENDVSHCEAIEDEDTKKTCIAAATKNPSLCDEFKDEGIRSRCVTWAAWGKKDPTVCEQLLNDNPRYTASSVFCYMYYAQFALDPGICGNIEDSSRRRQCVSQVDLFLDMKGLQ